MNLHKLFTLIAALVINHHANADLIDLDNGLVFESDRSITWLKDANSYKTLCDANAMVYQLWDTEIDNNKEDICNVNGQMTWNDAVSWVAHMNLVNYMGYDNWRLPSVVQPDASCETQNISGSRGYNCFESELGYLMNISLNNPNDAGTGSTGGQLGTDCAPDCFVNTEPFENTETFAYWSNLISNQDSGLAWMYQPQNNLQDDTKIIDDLYVWPVRNGSPPIQVIPVPANNLWAMLMIVMGLLFAGFRKYN